MAGPTPTPPTHVAPNRHPGVVLAVLCLCQFMVLLDMTIVNVSLEAIHRDLDLASSELSYVATAYTTLLGGFLLLGGRTADHLGRKASLLGGMAVFATASLTAALAREGWHLFVSRGVQGLGAAFLTTAALSTLTAVFEDGPARHRALGVWGALAGAGSAVGVVLGGALTDGPGWRWVFGLNVPVGVGAIAAAARWVPRTDRAPVRRLDVTGAVTATGALLLLIAGVARTEVAGWRSPATAATLAAGTALLAVFVAVERRSPQPLVDPAILARPLLRAANLIGVVSYGAGAGFFFVASLLMQQVYDYTPLQTGLAYLPVALAVLAGAQLAARLVATTSPRRIVVASLATTATALLLVARAPADPAFAVDLLGPFLLFGTSLGAIFVAVQVLAFAGTTSDEAGLAAGLISTSQEVGAALGVAVLATAAATTSGAAAATVDALHDGYRSALVLDAALLTVALALALCLLRRDATPPGQDLVPAGRSAGEPARDRTEHGRVTR